MSSPFSNKTYQKLFISHSISLFGTGITTIALALLTWEIASQNAGEILGTALALKMIVYVFLSPLAPQIIDKIPRKYLFISLDILRGALVLLLPFVNKEWHIYLLIVLINSCASLYTPLLQATIADIIKEEETYQKALSYSRLAYNLEQLLSPSIASVLLIVTTYSTLFILDSITFFISALLIFSCTIPNVASTNQSLKFLEKLQFGIVSYLKTPRLRAISLLYIIVAAASSMVIVNTVVILNGEETETAIAMALSGMGSMLTAFLLPRLLKILEVRTVLFSGAFILVVSLFGSIWVAGLLSLSFFWFFIGVGLTLIQTPVGSLVRLSSNEGDSPAYFAANFSLSHLCWLCMYPIVGYLVPQVGLTFTFAFLSVISLCALVIAWILYPNPDPLELEHTHEIVTHSHPHNHDNHHEHEHSHNDHIHAHDHTHKRITHSHRFVIDYHHQQWPNKH